MEKSAKKYQGSGKQYESGYAITGVRDPRANIEFADNSSEFILYLNYYLIG